VRSLAEQENRKDEDECRPKIVEQPNLECLEPATGQSNPKIDGKHIECEERSTSEKVETRKPLDLVFQMAGINDPAQ
jgi:hypothetical protein